MTTIPLERRTRVGIIGAGGIGSAYAAALQASDHLTCAAIADTDGERAERVADEVGARPFGDVAGLLDANECDIVVVATPPSMHEQHTTAAIDAGIDVLCEKPFAIGIGAAIRMFERAHDHGRLLAMASKFRYVDDLVRAKELIEKGRIGDPITVEVLFASTVDMSHRWNSVPAVSGGGVLIDNGTHAVDIVRFLLGDIRRVSAMGSVPRSSVVEHTGVILAETVGKAIATATVSWAVAPIGGTYVTVHGTDGSIDVGWSGSRYREAASEWVPFGSGYSKLDALRANVENFAAARSGREPLRNSVADVLASVSVIESVYDAIEAGVWVETPDHDALAARLVTQGLVTAVSSGR